MSDTQDVAPMSEIEAAAMESARLQNMTDEERRIAEAIREGKILYIPDTTVVNMVSLSRAQAKFINIQTKFFMMKLDRNSQEYMHELGAYSLAQTAFIDALQVALHQANVI